jgi:hypothetical protein
MCAHTSVAQIKENLSLAKNAPKTFPNINLMSTTANEIKNIINFLKSKKLCSYDEISTQVPKSCLGYNSVPYCYTCNQSMPVAALPERLTK